MEKAAPGEPGCVLYAFIILNDASISAEFCFFFFLPRLNAFNLHLHFWHMIWQYMQTVLFSWVIILSSISVSTHKRLYSGDYPLDPQGNNLFFIFLEWIRRLFLQSSKYAVNNMGKSCCPHKQRRFNDGVMSGRESMWVVYFKFGIVSKNSLQSFMVFLILSGCEQWNHCDQQALTPERWRSSEGPIWPTLGHNLIHTLNEAHPHCTPYSMQTTCVCVCLFKKSFSRSSWRG